MINKIFTCYDTKAKLHTRPFFYAELGEALRSFADCANDPKHNIGLHPGDYLLKEIGTFDESNGTITAYKEPIIHGTAVEYLEIPTHPNQIDLTDQPVQPGQSNHG